MSGDDYIEIDTIWKRHGKAGIIAPGEYSCPEFEFLAECEWVWSEKLDGTNVRITYHGNPEAMEATPWRAVGGRSKDAAHPVGLQDALYTLVQAAPWAKQFGEDETRVVLYGEGVGAGIRSGTGYGEQMSLVLFDVWIRANAEPGTKVNGWWLSREAVADVAVNFGLAVAPEVGRGTLAEACEMARAGFPSAQWDVDVAEGYVLRPAVEMHNRKGERVITKIKHNDYRRLESK